MGYFLNKKAFFFNFSMLYYNMIILNILNILNTDFIS